MSINVHLMSGRGMGWSCWRHWKQCWLRRVASVMQQECLQWNLLSDRAVSNQGYQHKMSDQIHHRQEKKKTFWSRWNSSCSLMVFSSLWGCRMATLTFPCCWKLGCSSHLPSQSLGLCFLQLSIPRCSPKPLWAPPARVCHQHGGMGWEFVQRVKTKNSPSCPSAQDGHSWSLGGCLTQVIVQMSLSFVEIR